MFDMRQFITVQCMKGGGLAGCCSNDYVSQDSCITVSELAAVWLKLMIPWYIMWPCNSWTHSAAADILLPQSP